MFYALHTFRRTLQRYIAKTPNDAQHERPNVCNAVQQMKLIYVHHSLERDNDSFFRVWGL